MERLRLVVMAADLAMDRALRARFGLTVPQIRFLQVVQSNQGINLGEAADQLRCSRGNLTSVADRVERDGWITRVRSKEDRRVINVFLTEDGIRRLPEALSVAARFNDVALPATVEQYLVSLQKQLEAAGA